MNQSTIVFNICYNQIHFELMVMMKHWFWLIYLTLKLGHLYYVVWALLAINREWLLTLLWVEVNTIRRWKLFCEYAQYFIHVADWRANLLFKIHKMFVLCWAFSYIYFQYFYVSTRNGQPFTVAMYQNFWKRIFCTQRTSREKRKPPDCLQVMHNKQNSFSLSASLSQLIVCMHSDGHWITLRFLFIFSSLHILVLFDEEKDLLLGTRHMTM